MNSKLNFLKIESEMKILDALNPDSVISNLSALNKKGIIEELVKAVSKNTEAESGEMIRVLLERERLGSTGIGDGIGIPHGKLKGLNKLVMAVGLSRKGVDFESLDGKPTHIFFLLVTPDNSTGLHLRLLARISRLLKDDAFKNGLKRAKDSKEMFKIISDADTEDF